MQLYHFVGQKNKLDNVIINYEILVKEIFFMDDIGV